MGEITSFLFQLLASDWLSSAFFSPSECCTSYYLLSPFSCLLLYWSCYLQASPPPAASVLTPILFNSLSFGCLSRTGKGTALTTAVAIRKLLFSFTLDGWANFNFNLLVLAFSRYSDLRVWRANRFLTIIYYFRFLFTYQFPSCRSVCLFMWLLFYFVCFFFPFIIAVPNLI